MVDLTGQPGVEEDNVKIAFVRDQYDRRACVLFVDKKVAYIKCHNKEIIR